MGYAKTIELGDNFEFGSTLENQESINTVASDVAFGSITLPNVSGRIRYVFLDVCFRLINNTSVLINYLENAADVLVDNGTTTTAYTFPVGSFYCPPGFASYEFPGCRYYGSIDVKAKFSLGGTTDVYLHDAVAHHDGMNLRDLFSIARVVLW
jgi:hypothetical protein